MAETEYSTTSKLQIQRIWDFVKEMDNWAPMLAGYQSHEKRSETDSLWTIKGDVGVLARTVQFQVHITEWNGPERVRFELQGVNEQLKGEGIFIMEPYEEETESIAPPRKNLFVRMVEGIVRFFFRLFRGKTKRAESADTVPGEGMAKLTFKLRVDPAGPMAPMIDAMIKPAMAVAAEDLANKIMAHLETKT